MMTLNFLAFQKFSQLSLTQFRLYFVCFFFNFCTTELIVILFHVFKVVHVDNRIFYATPLNSVQMQSLPGQSQGSIQMGSEIGNTVSINKRNAQAENSPVNR